MTPHFLFSSLAAFVLTLLLVACRSQPAAPVPAAPPPSQVTEVNLTEQAATNAGIKVTALSPQAFSPRLQLPAVLVGDPSAIAHVGARVTGRVVAIRVKLGDEVRKGQPLVDVESIDIHEATLKYLTSQARAGAAKDALARQRMLVREQVGAEADLRRAEAEYASAKAAVDEAQEHLRFLGLSPKAIKDLQDHEASGEHAGILRAPIAGRVTSLNVSMGQVLGGGEDVLTLANTKRVWASLRAYERDLPYIELGRAVEITVPSVPSQTFAGTIDFISDLVDPVTRTTEVRVPLDNTSGKLRPGATATASIALPTDGEGLWVPEVAVQLVEGRPSVFVRTAPNTFAPRVVEAGPVEGGFRRLLSGVTAGEPIVTEGAFALRGEMERANLTDEE